LAAGFRRLRYASAPANIHRASGAEEFASKIFRSITQIEDNRVIRFETKLDLLIISRLIPLGS
jgi:hypothetical protein